MLRVAIFSTLLVPIMLLASNIRVEIERFPVPRRSDD